MLTLTELSIQDQREIERAFAAAAYAHPEDAYRTCGWLQPDTLFDEGVRKFWKSMNNGHKGDAAGAAMEAGILFDVTGWMIDYPTTYVEAYANEIARRAYMISLDKPLAEIAKARRENNVEKVRELLRKLYDGQPAGSDNIPDAADIHLKFAEWMAADRKTIKTYIGAIDRAMGGLDYDILSVLFSRPSMGKSTLAWQIARNVSQSKKKVGVFSNEMSVIQLWLKAACAPLNIDYRRVKDKSITEEEYDRIIKYSGDLAEAYGHNLKVDERTHHTVETIWQVCAKEQFDLVIVDILSNVKDFHPREVQRLEIVARGLKDMAKNLNSHVMALHHASRKSVEGAKEGHEVPPPALEDLRESGGLEQAADVVLALQSQTKLRGGKLPAVLNDMDLWDLKDRDGMPNKRIELKFELASQWFESRNP